MTKSNFEEYINTRFVFMFGGKDKVSYKGKLDFGLLIDLIFS